MKDISSLIFLLFLFFSNVHTTKFSFLKSKFGRSLLQMTAEMTPLVSSKIQGLCFLNVNSTIYDLNPSFNSSGDIVHTFLTGAKMNLNVCRRAFNNCPNKTAYLTYNDSRTCTALTGEDILPTTFSFIKNPETKETSIIAELPQGDSCLADQWKNYIVKLNFTCNKKDKNITFDFDKFDINSCENTIDIVTPYACPQENVYGLWSAIQRNSIVIAVFLGITGIYLTFFANKLIIVTQVTTGILTVNILIFYFGLYYMESGISDFQMWLAFSVCLTLGGLVGWLLTKFDKISIYVLSGLAGLVMGDFIYNVVLSIFQQFNLVLFWTFIFCFTLCGVIFSVMWTKNSTIISSSFLGAYLILKGISFNLSGFPDERQINDLLMFSEYEQVKKLYSNSIYILFGIFWLVSVIGMIIQLKYFDNEESTERKKSFLKEEVRLDDTSL